MRLDSGAMGKIYAQLDADSRRSVRATCKEWAALGAAVMPMRLRAVHDRVSDMRDAFHQALQTQEFRAKMRDLRMLELVLRVPRPRLDAEDHDEQAWHWSMIGIAEDARALCPGLRCVIFGKPGFGVSDALGFAAIYAPGSWRNDFRRRDKTVLFRG